VDVFDSSFHPVTILPATAFKDPNLPSNFAPFGIANIDNQLYVTFALQKLPDRHDEQAGPGNEDGTREYISKFPTSMAQDLRKAIDMADSWAIAKEQEFYAARYGRNAEQPDSFGEPAED
jgi:hypothetical protein